MSEEVLSIAGDPVYPVTLQVTYFKPPGPGPFPLAVMNHGATNASASNRGDRYRFTTSAYYFLSRGYAVALPMARGFAGSGGGFVHEGCDLAKVARRNGRDVAAVLTSIASRPEIDRNRIVVSGQSFGAWTTLGLGAEPPPGVRGLIDFNPAIRSSDCRDQDRSMAAAAGQLGAKTSLPSLWFYGENDSIMPVATWRAVFDSYTKAGARAELVDFGTYGSDSHQLLSFAESMPVWTPKVDAFLARIGLPSTIMYPQYLPHAVPPATKWAALTDVAAVPYLSDRGRDAYRHFLAGAKPRAAVIASNGSISSASGGYDPLGFALRACNKNSPQPCRPYAVNDDVVWVPPTDATAEAPTVRSFTKLIPKNSSALVGSFYAVNKDCSSRGLATITISQQPLHGRVTVGEHAMHPTFPAENPNVGCNAGMVQARDLSYTATAGYSGPDTVAFEEVDAEGRHRLFRGDLTVQ